MRSLQTHDVFACMRIIKAAGIKTEFERISKLVQENKDISIREVGMGLIFNCIEAFAGTTSEKAFYEFLSGPLEMKAKDIETMDPFDLIQILTEYVESIDKEKISSFFKSVSALMTTLS